MFDPLVEFNAGIFHGVIFSLFQVLVFLLCQSAGKMRGNKQQLAANRFTNTKGGNVQPQRPHSSPWGESAPAVVLETGVTFHMESGNTLAV